MCGFGVAKRRLATNRLIVALRRSMTPKTLRVVVATFALFGRGGASNAWQAAHCEDAEDDDLGEGGME